MADLTYYNDLANSITSSGAPLDTAYLSQETQDLIHNLQIPGHYYRQKQQEAAAEEERRRREYWEEEWGGAFRRGLSEWAHQPMMQLSDIAYGILGENDFSQRVRDVSGAAYRYRPEDTTFWQKASSLTGQVAGSSLISLMAGAAGGPYAAFAAATLPHYGMALRRNRENGMDEASAVAEAAVESLSVGSVETLLGNVPFISKLTRGVGDDAAKGIFQQILSKTAGKISQAADKNIATRIISNLASNSVEEGFEEIVQYALEAAGESFSETVGKGTPFEDAWGENFSWDELVDNGLAGLYGGMILGGPATAIDNIVNKGYYDFQRAQKDGRVQWMTDENGMAILDENGNPRIRRILANKPDSPVTPFVLPGGNQPAASTDQPLSTAANSPVIDQLLSATEAELTHILTNMTDDQLFATAARLGIPGVQPGITETMKVYNKVKETILREAAAGIQASAAQETTPVNTPVSGENSIARESLLPPEQAITVPPSAQDSTPVTAEPQAPAGNRFEYRPQDGSSAAVDTPATVADSTPVTPTAAVPQGNTGNTPTSIPPAPADTSNVTSAPQTTATAQPDSTSHYPNPRITLPPEYTGDPADGSYEPQNVSAYTGEVSNGDLGTEQVSNYPETPPPVFHYQPSEVSQRDQRAIKAYQEELPGQIISPASNSELSKDEKDVLIAVQRISRALGVSKAMPVKSVVTDPGKATGFNGAHLPGAEDKETGVRRNLLNMSTSQSPADLFHTAMHELTHSLVEKDEAAYNKLWKCIKALKNVNTKELKARLQNYAKQRGYQRGKLTKKQRNTIEKEFICDTVADLMLTEKFWDVLSKQDMTLAQKFLKALKDLLGKLKGNKEAYISRTEKVFGENLEKVIKLAQQFVIEASGKSNLSSLLSKETAVTATGEAQTTAAATPKEKLSVPPESDQSVSSVSSVQTPSDTAAPVEQVGEQVGEQVAEQGKKKKITIADLNKQAQAKREAKQGKAETATAEQTDDVINRQAADYEQRFGTVINTDNAKLLFKDDGYDPHDAESVKKFHPQASSIVRKLFDKFLKERKGKGNGFVVFTGGGNGSGKSSAMNNDFVKNADFVFDSAMVNYEAAKDSIQKVIDNGQKPLLAFVYRNPADAWFNGVQKRNQSADGHIVPEATFINTHAIAKENFLKLVSDFGDKVQYIIKEVADGKASDISLEELENKPKYTKDQIKEAINAESYTRARAILERLQQSDGKATESRGSELAPGRTEKRSDEVQRIDTGADRDSGRVSEGQKSGSVTSAESIISKITSAKAGSRERIMAFTELPDGEHTVNGKSFTKSGNTFTLDGKTLNAKEIEKATRTTSEKMRKTVEETVSDAEIGYTPQTEEKPEKEPTTADRTISHGKKETSAPSAEKSAPEKIEDYGEKIGGARKDIIRQYADKINLNGATFAKMFPKPDYAKLLEAGIKIDVLAKLKTAYDMAKNEVKKHRTMDGRQNLNVAKFFASYAKAALLGEDSVDFKDNNWGFTEHGKRTVTIRSQAMEQLLKELGVEYADVDLKGFDITDTWENGVKPEKPKWYGVQSEEWEKRYRVWAIYGKTGFFDKVEDAIKYFIELVKKHTTLDKPKYKIKMYKAISGEHSGEHYITAAIRGFGDVPLQYFKTYKEAYSYLHDHADDLQHQAAEMEEQKKAERKSKFTGKDKPLRLRFNSETLRDRIGIDYRNGKDVSAKEFAEKFNFRAVEFGNSVSQKERQIALNALYDSLLDLANVLGISPEAMSLNGKLAFAYGARGVGNAEAHYEPKKNVINLTKTRGAGNVAHEWWHALDFYFANSESKSAMDGKYRDDIRPEVKKVFEELQKLFSGSSEYVTRSERLDAFTKKEYYTQPTEMAARAFADYVSRQLEAQGQINDFLSSQVSEADWKGEENTYPYPTGDDAVKIGDTFQSLFNTIDEKNDESGNTVLFSLTDDKANFSSALEDFKNGVLDKRKPITVTSDTPSVILKLDLSDLGLRVFNRKITMPYSVIEKAIGNIASTSTGDFHALDIETLKELPENLHNPVMILEGNLPGTIEIYTLMFDKKNNPVMIALAIDVTEKVAGKKTREYIVNSIRSIYGKDNPNTPLNKLKKGKGRYVNMKLADIWRRAVGVQFPEAGDIISGSPYTIIVDDQKVNPVSSKNPENSSGGVKLSMSGDLETLTPQEEADLQNNEDFASEIGNGIKFSKVADRPTLDRLNAEEKAGDYLTLYRSVQIGPDGKLHSPMAAKVAGKWGPEIELGVWEQSDEHPELAKAKIAKDGKIKYLFDLNKGNGKTIGGVLYNPYIHSSNTMLNDQFSEAYQRPELVTVEVHVPKSELTSGYKAQRANDAVGMKDWKAGVVQGKLTGKRKVMLSRWDKPVRIVPDSEVAQHIKELIGDKDIAIPANVVTPALRAELEKIGVEIDYSVKEYDPEKEKTEVPKIKFSLTGDLDLGDTSLSPEDYRRSIDPLFDFVMEYTDGVVNPGSGHIGEEFTGSYISPEYKEYSVKRKQGAKESDASYQRYLARREESLNNASGVAVDDIAAAYVRKFGGDEKQIEEYILDMLRYLNKRDLVSDRAEAKREVREFEKEQRKEDIAAMRELKEKELTSQVNDLFEAKEKTTVDKRWVQMHRQIYPKLYKTVFPFSENVPDIPSRREMDIINLALQNGNMNEAAKLAEPYYTDKNLEVKQDFDGKRTGILRNVTKTITGAFGAFGESDPETKKDLSLLNRIVTPPQHIADKYGNENNGVKEIYQATQDYIDDKARMVIYLTDDLHEKVNTLNKQSYKKVNDYIVESDRNQTGAGKVVDNGDSLFSAFDGDGKNIGEFTSMDEAAEKIFTLEHEKLLNNGYSQAEADAVLAFRRAMYRTYKFRMDYTMLFLRKLGLIDAESTSFIIENVKDYFPELAADETIPGKIDLFKLMSEMGQHIGYYFPRIRHGKFMMKATKNGKIVIKGYDSRLARFGSHIMRKFKGYKVENFLSNAPDQDVLAQTDPAAMMDILNQAFNRAKKKLENSFALDEVVYTKKDGSTEIHLVMVPQNKLNIQTTMMLKDIGGKFFDGAWHFSADDSNVKDQITEILSGQTEMETRWAMLMQTSIGESIVDMIRETSSGSSKIHRRTAIGNKVTRGYERDLRKASALYIGGVAGSTARNVMAKKMYSAFAGMCFDKEKYINDLIPADLEYGSREYQRAKLNATSEYYKEVRRRALDSSKQPELTKYMGKYIKDMLRNTTRWERNLGKLKGISAVWMLGKPQSALSNLVSAIGTNPMVINRETGCGITNAIANNFKGMGLYLNYASYNKLGIGKKPQGEIKEIFDIIHANGWDGAELCKDAVDAGLTFAKRGWKKTSDLLLVFFSSAEKLNRASAIYSAYNALLKKEGIDGKNISDAERFKLLKKAKEISDFSNGVYNKGNKVDLARGGNLAAIVDAGLLFKTYEANLWHNLVKSAKMGDIKGITYFTASLMLSGGFKASLVLRLSFKGIALLGSLLGWWEKDDEETGEEYLYRQIYEWNPYVARAVKYGVFAAIPGIGVNLSGTFQHTLSDLADNGLWDGEIKFTDFPAFAIFEMLCDYYEYRQNGQHLKAIESLSPALISSGIRAFREGSIAGFGADEGVTDRAGRRRKDEHDEYIKPDTVDTIVRLAGFNPVSISERTDRVWSEKKIKESYAEMRRDILGRYRDMVNDGNPSQEELADLALEIEAYNARVRRSGRNIPYIDDVSLRNALSDTENKFFTAGLDEKAQRRRENKGNKKLVIRNGRIVRE